VTLLTLLQPEGAIRPPKELVYLPVRPGPITNWLPDPGFESGALIHGYRIVETGVTDTSRIVASPAISGDGSLRLSVSGNATGVKEGPLVRVGWRVRVDLAEPGSPWSAAAMADYITPALGARLALAFEDAAQVQLEQHFVWLRGEVAPRARLKVEGKAAPEGTVWVRFELGLMAGAVPAQIGQAVCDECMLVDDDEVPEDFFDGDSGGAYWLGARYGSPSTLRNDAATLEEMRYWVPPYFYSRPELDSIPPS
jgi:hypothetical protein